MMMMLKNP